MKKLVTITLSVFLAGCLSTPPPALPQEKNVNQQNDNVNEAVVEDKKINAIAPPSTGTPKVEKPQSETISTNVVYAVPFTSQAPFEVWDELHGEACEEASMIMVHRYFNKQSLTPHTADQEIISQVRWQEDNNYTVDITASEVAGILQSYYNLNAEAQVISSHDDIILALNANNLVIVPAAGRLLANPYFTEPGPLYHMLVIRGYDQSKQEFITNDPGTKRGEGFRYSYQNLYSAIHDWPVQGAGKDTIDEFKMNNGQKIMIVVKGII